MKKIRNDQENISTVREPKMEHEAEIIPNSSLIYLIDGIHPRNI